MFALLLRTNPTLGGIKWLPTPLQTLIQRKDFLFRDSGSALLNRKSSSIWWGKFFEGEPFIKTSLPGSLNRHVCCPRTLTCKSNQPQCLCTCAGHVAFVDEQRRVRQRWRGVGRESARDMRHTGDGAVLQVLLLWVGVGAVACSKSTLFDATIGKWSSKPPDLNNRCQDQIVSDPASKQELICAYLFDVLAIQISK